MPQTKPLYPLEFRHQMVELVRSICAPEDLAREFKPSAQTIRNWIAQAASDSGERSDEPTSAEAAELRRLRRGVCQEQLTYRY